MHGLSRSSTSDLLSKLPREVRDRIWFLVFGGRSIHVTRGDKVNAAVVISPCFSRKDTCPQLDSAVEGEDGWLASHSFLENHRECGRRMKQKYSIIQRVGHRHSAWLRLRLTISDEVNGNRVLLACRQVYMEAAHLPLALTTPIFDSPQTMLTWLGMLQPAQMRAINTVVLLESPDGDHHRGVVEPFAKLSIFITPTASTRVLYRLVSFKV